MIKNSNNWKLVNFYIFIGIFLAIYWLFWFFSNATFFSFWLKLYFLIIGGRCWFFRRSIVKSHELKVIAGLCSILKVPATMIRADFLYEEIVLLRIEAPV